MEATVNGPPREEAPLAAPLHLLDLADDGSQSDETAGDQVYTFAVPPGAGLDPARYLLGVQAVNAHGQTIPWWPFLEVTGGSAGGRRLPGGAGEPDGSGARAGGLSIPLGGYYATRVGPGGGLLNLFVRVDHPDGQAALSSVELCYAGVPTGVLLEPVGYSFHALSLELPPGIPAGDYLLEVQAHDSAGRSSNFWPHGEIR